MCGAYDLSAHSPRGKTAAAVVGDTTRTAPLANQTPRRGDRAVSGAIGRNPPHADLAGEGYARRRHGAQRRDRPGRLEHRRTPRTPAGGVAASALTILVVQGSLTVIGFALGGFLTYALIAALTATGGLLLVGVGLRLLRIRQVPVGDLLPALIIAPLLVEAVVTVR
jgi:hypothetical protein